MNFVSLEYILFFSVATSLFFWLPARNRLALLLGAGILFYGSWRFAYLLILAATALTDYLVALGLQRTTSPAKKKALLAASLAGNLGTLFTFKYSAFFAHTATAITGVPLPTFELVLPVGISFYTFQSMAYTIDVYRGLIQAERSLVRFLAFVVFFPQLVAGPIERWKHMQPQFLAVGSYDFDYQRVVLGLRRILWGAFKKVVISGMLAIYVDEVYNHTQRYRGPALFVATLFFTFQIYCDFSGYTDIALGSAKILGFELTENFRQPYFSTSIREFWRRWHISLSFWFRDYVYIPLGGARAGFGRQLGNLIAVFAVSGLWHGASWTFIVWGLVHGLVAAVETVVDRVRGRPAERTKAGWAYTFLVASIAWIFFRAKTVADALWVLAHMFDSGPASVGVFDPYRTAPSFGLFQKLPGFATAVAAVFIGSLILVDRIESRGGFGQSLDRLSRPRRWVVYYALSILLLFFAGARIGVQDFIYFQF
ncbi:MAG: MBOAT family O-acyltransferase [Vicinamibacterales bacterium]